MLKTIEIVHQGLSGEELIVELDGRLGHEGIQLKCADVGVRGMETAVVVAVITGGAQVLTALISAIIALARDRKPSEHIVVTGRGGRKYQLPAELGIDDLRQFVPELEALERARIVFQTRTKV